MLQWLKSSKYADKVKQIRAINEKEKRDTIKATLPAITPSGIFSYRHEDHLIQHSGLVQFDIDAKENQHLSNYATLKQQISNICNVAYVGLSVSGKGFWGLVPIRYPGKHKQHFRALFEAFKSFGLLIDRAPQNVASLRGYSYDPDGYFNHNAEVFEYLKPKSQPKPTQFNPTNTGYETRKKVEQLISKINTDITAGYHTWRNLGFALEDEFGESGRKYFHAISRYHSEYNRQECDRQYTQCLKHRGSGISIGTFFHLCREHGIELKRERADHAPQKEKPLESRYESQKNGNNSKNEYPAEWDNIQVKRETQAYKQATRVALQDCDTDIERLQIKDPIVGQISTLFDGKVPEKNGA